MAYGVDVAQVAGRGGGRGAAGRRHSEEGDALLLARTRLSLTQPAFADRLSEVLGRRVDRTQVAKWEAGVYRPRTGVMLAAAGLVAMPLHELMAEGAKLRGPRAPAGPGPQDAAAATGSPATARPRDLADPREQLRALLALGFSLPEAIDLVQEHGAEPAAGDAGGQ